MKGSLRRYLASLMAVVYLLAVGSAALSSLLCPCVRHQHTCASCCCQAHCASVATDCDCAEAAAKVAKTCCGKSHSTEIALYTAGDEDTLRRLWRTMQPTAVAVMSDGVTLADFRMTDGERFLPLQEPLIESDSGGLCALRAPPVTA